MCWGNVRARREGPAAAAATLVAAAAERRRAAAQRSGGACSPMAAPTLWRHVLLIHQPFQQGLPCTFVLLGLVACGWAPAALWVTPPLCPPAAPMARAALA